MNQLQPANFDDPKFRAAMRQALAGESAPGGLKQKIASSLAVEAAAELPIPAPRAAGWVGRTMAMRIAASIIALVGVGLLAYQLRNEFWPQRPTPARPALAVALLQKMVERHDATVAQLSSNPPSPGSDFAAIGSNLSAKLGKPVASMKLGDQWTLKSADLAMVGQTQSAQLLFVRGQTTVSLLSVPADPGYQPADGTRYDNDVSGHRVSGVVKNGVIYCLIAQSKDNSLTSEELTSLREKVATLMGAPAASSCGSAGDQTASARPDRS
jgi:hypothetical protein